MPEKNGKLNLFQDGKSECSAEKEIRRKYKFESSD